MNKGLGIALIAALILVGCGGNAADEARKARERNPAPCPSAVVLQDAARQIEFDGDPSLETVAWSAEFQDVSLYCRYFSDKPIDVEIELSVAVGRGPAAEGDRHQFAYFVAVTRRDMEVIAKRTFAREVKFGKKERVKTFREKIDDIVIPRAREEIAGANFEVVVGLVVTREQAIYNRSGKSLKFPEL
ncbi:MAG: hypothetical protein AAFX08_07165 [Pseudomonadota bacterium]